MQNTNRKDRQEVLNYLNVLENIGKLIKGDSIHEKDILDIHRMVTEDTLDNPEDSGVYRNRYVVVANRLTGEVFFTCAVLTPNSFFVLMITMILIDSHITEHYKALIKKLWI